MFWKNYQKLVTKNFFCYNQPQHKLNINGENILATRIEYGIDTEIELQEPKKYKVILLNDNYSTVEFVIQVLMQIFKKNLEEATAITMSIHENGRGVCGIYTYEIAQTKVAEVRANARKAEFPLKAIVEEE